jgi:predicted DNA-binding protein (MmcQ/YjbR family)
MADPRRAHRKLVAFALGFPGAYEDHPWGEVVAKVGKKVFVFFGSEDDPSGSGMTVKLPESQEQALSIPGIVPAGYGLGRSGWVSFAFGTPALPPLPVLRDWVEESYRTVAPKKLVAEWDAQSGPARRTCLGRSN